MGFGNFLKGAAKAAGNAIVEKTEAIQQEKDRIAHFSDEKLYELGTRGQGNRRIAARMLLKERGYEL
ncbi:hypothetical protein I6G82_03510 [Lysinibacillus macroides]|uniref:Uncharacterized protein n=1 Tax=Lysinibacillus macroides TaxID=33935 RepID=A0A0N0CV22_9BACI|nr:hypothetical protein [Lysinibacillus macroides]KOY81131.1 hypothetical protein ADM90_18460 [Lysinibacillus macroides]QPR68715.1 hypothetical protein I6G82_03510 [Lysinibacillus macroides]